VKEFSVDDFKASQKPASPHVTDFATALDLYKRVKPTEIPVSIRIFTIGINSKFTFTEGLSQPVQRAALKLTDLIAAELEAA
jgi:Ni,Fe-hydrogenase maturation factor